MPHRIGWLRTAVIEANDALVPPSSLVVGVAETGPGKPEILIARLAGLVTRTSCDVGARLSKT